MKFKITAFLLIIAGIFFACHIEAVNEEISFSDMFDPSKVKEGVESFKETKHARWDLFFKSADSSLRHELSGLGAFIKEQEMRLKKSPLLKPVFSLHLWNLPGKRYEPYFLKHSEMVFKGWKKDARNKEARLWSSVKHKVEQFERIKPQDFIKGLETKRPFHMHEIHTLSLKVSQEIEWAITETKIQHFFNNLYRYLFSWPSEDPMFKGTVFGGRIYF